MNRNQGKTLPQIRLAVREIFDCALRAVDPREAVRRAVSFDGSHLRVVDTVFDHSGEIFVVSIGKAALSMALGLNDVIGEKITSGVITCPEESHASLVLTTRWQVFHGGHPLPDEASLAAAQAVFSLLARADNEHAVVIFLVSGGGSAMLEWPLNDEITLRDLREANRLLVHCGASIKEINVVRRAFSAVKGGSLAARAPQSKQVTLIVSDTNRGDEASVASGPTLTPGHDRLTAAEVVRRYDLESVLPASILGAAEARTAKETSQRSHGPHYVLLDNFTAIEAAAQRASSLGFAVAVTEEITEQSIEEGCKLLLSRLHSSVFPAGSDSSVCLISGGEFSCPVLGAGRGGRNLETVLRCALKLDERDAGAHTVVLSAGTDGIDGNSPAAGAIADETTIRRAEAIGLSAEEFLERSDSYTFFEKLGDLIVTGPTGTNVRDLRIVIRSG